MINTTMAGNLTHDPEIRYTARRSADRVFRIGCQQTLAAARK